MAGSILAPGGNAAGPLLELLVGNGAQDGVEMGPLVTSDDGVFDCGGVGLSEKAEANIRKMMERAGEPVISFHYRQIAKPGVASEDALLGDAAGPALCVSLWAR